MAEPPSFTIWFSSPKVESYHSGEILEPAICCWLFVNPYSGSGTFFRSWQGRSLGPHEVLWTALFCPFLPILPLLILWNRRLCILYFVTVELCHVWLGSKIFVYNEVEELNQLTLVLSLEISPISAPKTLWLMFLEKLRQRFWMQRACNLSPHYSMFTYKSGISYCVM